MANHEDGFSLGVPPDAYWLPYSVYPNTVDGLVHGSPEKFEAAVFALMQSDEFKHLLVREILGSLEIIKASLLDAST